MLLLLLPKLLTPRTTWVLGDGDLDGVTAVLLVLLEVDFLVDVDDRGDARCLGYFAIGEKRKFLFFAAKILASKQILAKILPSWEWLCDGEI